MRKHGMATATHTLSPLDAMFLELEQSDEGAVMSIGAAMVFAPLPSGGAPPFDQVVRDLGERLQQFPRFSQRLSTTRTGGLRWPTWEPVDHFEIADHVHRATLPSPGGDEELNEWISDFYSHRLDRTRPLWEMALLEGLQDGRWAMVSKIHHCLVDGVGGIDVGQLLLDPSPNPSAQASAPHQLPTAPRADAGDAGGANRGSRLPWWTPPGMLWHGARATADLALHPDQLLELAGRARAMAGVLVRDELVAAPKSSLNVQIGATRRFRALRFTLDDFKEIKVNLGGTVNDVALALCAGGLRSLLLGRGDELPAAGLRGQIPVNIRPTTEDLALGNRLTSLFIPLHVAESDPLERYRRTVDEAEALKRGSQATGARALIELTGLAPPGLHIYLAQSLFDVRLFNLTVTNVPGPRSTLYSFGVPMLELLPLVPLFARHSVGIAIFSYDGGIVIGLNADRDTVPDLDVLADGIEQSFAELKQLARGATHHDGAATPRKVEPTPATKTKSPGAKKAAGGAEKASATRKRPAPHR
jgi:diacylglycerol O-acyltransferase / wax synthase